MDGVPCLHQEYGFGAVHTEGCSTCGDAVHCLAPSTGGGVPGLVPVQAVVCSA
jgi:hypothetical protein